MIPVGWWVHSAAKDAGVRYPSDEWVGREVSESMRESSAGVLASKSVAKASTSSSSSRSVPVTDSTYGICHGVPGLDVAGVGA